MNDDLGILIESENEEALFEKLNLLIDNHHQYDKDRIRQYALDHFSREVIGKQLFEVYRAVCK
jgi:glycosyltransferase involved in cell wall biosynthesis